MMQELALDVVAEVLDCLKGRIGIDPWALPDKAREELTEELAERIAGVVGNAFSGAFEAERAMPSIEPFADAVVALDLENTISMPWGETKSVTLRDCFLVDIGGVPFLQAKSTLSDARTQYVNVEKIINLTVVPNGNQSANPSV